MFRGFIPFFDATAIVALTIFCGGFFMLRAWGERWQYRGESPDTPAQRRLWISQLALTIAVVLDVGIFVVGRTNLIGNYSFYISLYDLSCVAVLVSLLYAWRGEGPGRSFLRTGSMILSAIVLLLRIFEVVWVVILQKTDGPLLQM